MVAPFRISPANEVIAKAKTRESIPGNDFMLRLLYPIASRYCYPKSIGRDGAAAHRPCQGAAGIIFYHLSPTNMSARRTLLQSAPLKKFLAPNLQSEGRSARKVTALVFAVTALVCFPFSRRLSLLLFAAALFTLFEAMRGWCVLRACGIKTKV